MFQPNLIDEYSSHVKLSDKMLSSNSERREFCFLTHDNTLRIFTSKIFQSIPRSAYETAVQGGKALFGSVTLSKLEIFCRDTSS